MTLEELQQQYAGSEDSGWDHFRKVLAAGLMAANRHGGGAILGSLLGAARSPRDQLAEQIDALQRAEQYRQKSSLTTAQIEAGKAQRDLAQFGLEEAKKKAPVTRLLDALKTTEALSETDLTDQQAIALANASNAPVLTYPQTFQPGEGPEINVPFGLQPEPVTFGENTAPHTIDRLVRAVNARTDVMPVGPRGLYSLRSGKMLVEPETREPINTSSYAQFKQFQADHPELSFDDQVKTFARIHGGFRSGADAVDELLGQLGARGGEGASAPKPAAVAAPATAGKKTEAQLRAEANDAIKRGADRTKVAARFRQMTGKDL